MKEASGEANMTIITIVLIAIVLSVGTIVVNRILNSTKRSSCCNTAGGTMFAGKCYGFCTQDSATGKISSCDDTSVITDINSTTYAECIK